ncbi:MAG: penicillin-binding protein 2 [Candidatus Omnitrophota bacterium]|nr:MAG: penicillin-binding protein 2 [Candidatus Omnitrophota bacterium]
MYTRATKFRSLFILFLLLFCFAILLGRVFYLHFVPFSFPIGRPPQYRVACKVEPQRGNIYDRRGNKLAISLQTDSIYASPRQIKDKVKVAQLLSAFLDIDEQKLISKLCSDRSFVWIKRQVSQKERRALESAHLKGIYFLPEKKRFYPQGELAAHVLGFCGIDNKGLEGVEFFYDDYLKGREGWRFAQKDGHSQEIAGLEKEAIPVVNGANLTLTLDIIIQYIVEKELKKTVEEYKPSSASVIVLNPHTGEVLALANYPTFDPNTFFSFSPSYYRNRAITDIFEPGSTFKIVSACAALEEGVVSLEDRFYCERGRYCFKGHILHDYHPYGELSFSEVIVKSSNIGISKIAQRLGKRKLYEYILKFGFASASHIDLPGEAKGLLKPVEKWDDISMLNIPMGQGIGVTAMQMACAISVIANGGELIKPYVVKQITDENGEVIKRFLPSKRRIISRKTAERMREVLQRVVEKGTGRRAQIRGYKVAGKTGTAQKPSPSGGYYKDRFVSSFIGFLPADNPLICIAVVIDEPKGAHFGSIVAAPLFQRIGKQVMEYLL